MSEGLITRIGRWIDYRWESKATESEMRHLFNSLENAAIKDVLDVREKIQVLNERLDKDIFGLQQAIADIETAAKLPSENVKELTDLKTRMEKIELYAGMTRKVDPTKPPVAKSAFAM